MPNHESHSHHGPGPGHHGPGHHGPGHFGDGPGKMRRPLQFFFVNAIITQFFARAWMVVSAIALMKIASSLALGARVKMMSDLRADLSEEQRTELLDDIWRRARRKRMMCCPMMPKCCSPENPAEQ